MNLARVQQEFADAQRTFAYIEWHPTYDGSAFVKAALQGPLQLYALSIKFPDNYPNEMPKVYIDAPALSSNSPHRYQSGNICFLHPSMWNPGAHNITFVMGRVAKWINKYDVWRQTGIWPGKEVKH